MKKNLTKKEALSIVFKSNSPVICLKFDRRKKIVKEVLDLFTISELKEIETKRLKRYRIHHDASGHYMSITDIKHDLTLYRRSDNYRKILIEGNKHIYWAHPVYLHKDYNKSIFAENTPANRKRMRLINSLLSK